MDATHAPPVPSTTGSSCVPWIGFPAVPRAPPLALKDSVEAGYEYLVVIGKDRLPLDPVTCWWFDHMNVSVRYAETLAEDEHPEHTVLFVRAAVFAHGRPGRSPTSSMSATTPSSTISPPSSRPFTRSTPTAT